jgi:foldase protein PrsA
MVHAADIKPPSIASEPHRKAMMKKLILLVGALSLVAAACSSNDEVISSVNGEEITRSSVESLVRDSGDGFSNQDLATYLTVMIQWEAAEQAASEEFAISVTDEQTDARVEELVATSAQGATLDEYLESVNATESGFRSFAESLLVQEAIEAELVADLDPVTDDDIAQEIAEFPGEWTQVCAAHILVETQEEADDIKAQLDDGADFAALATELSLDTGSAEVGGDLGCAAPSGFVGPFAEATMTAEVDIVTDPIETEFGYHLIIVNERTEAPSDSVRAYLEQQRSQAVLEAWFNAMIEGTDVTVIDSVGTWVTEPTPQVLASN